MLPTTANSSYACKFTPGGWQPKDWIMVKSARWDSFQDHWIQKEDYIQNPSPDRPVEIWYTLAKGDESYTSMVYYRKFHGDVVVKSTMQFDPTMAPLIVFADELGRSKSGQPEYRNHIEIIIYNLGVNVWAHTYDPQKKSPTWQLLAYNRISLKPKTRYLLEVQKKGKMLTITVDGRTFGVLAPQLGEDCYIGITGCEGYNRFYDFSVTPQ
jgi:hypothetical protein